MKHSGTERPAIPSKAFLRRVLESTVEHSQSTGGTRSQITRTESQQLHTRLVIDSPLEIVHNQVNNTFLESARSEDPNLLR